MTSFTQVAIIGAGTMGGGIAISAICNGIEVTLIDTSEEALSRVKQRVAKYLERQVEKGRMSMEIASIAGSRLHVSTDFASAADADLVIEAVFEDLEVKKSVFSQLELIVSEACHLATNTSGLKVSDIGRTLTYPDRLCGLHYFSPAELNPIVEVVLSDTSLDSTIDAALSFLEQCRKTPIKCNDQSGFALNRFFCPYTNEAARCLDDGLGTPAQIDAVAKDAFGVPVGPFFVMNIVKPRINLAAVRNLAHLGPFYTPANSLSVTGDADENWEIEKNPAALNPQSHKVVADRLRGAVFFAVQEELNENIAKPEDIDLGARSAFGFNKGPVKMMDELSNEEVVRLIRIPKQ
ncbi:3-hydroxyacyl-CoA dehydrogenase [Kiloniella spongiae]|uniref:3-hydroxyacyl-CoA dehydrogenase n=1 Tax=Kiloniella spongiae TaxID=1489064 RepID=UPI00069C25DA|nr:3-hydroxyacyl-CoA dehydrogenase [Kiloniella spongiae]